MNRKITFLLFGLILLFNQVSGQTIKHQFDFKQGSVTLKNGTILHGEVANIKHGFRDKLLDRVRIKPTGKALTKKYPPSKILGYSMGTRQFVSWRVQRNNALFKEMYTIHAGNEYKIFELQEEGHLSIYLEYFVDDDLWIRSVPFFLKKDELVMVRATQGLFGLKRNLFSDYFSDSPPLMELIDGKKITTPEEVAIFYNNWKEEQLNPK
ncbi:hypothetical protein M3O96_16250 [Aquiflexum sp. TKW24L]|uniref:hypothetical protein n=1 Tax=Aquiflexum sp. TKW24L TaxID=2942212 RepID=UPI0020BD766E|nr:hypothetical protein [Aquiflexum sp. TKW24L]MCL6260657.1 hypothetical protein [Aquiflexum sp. TKW24L]